MFKKLGFKAIPPKIIDLAEQSKRSHKIISELGAVLALEQAKLTTLKKGADTPLILRQMKKIRNARNIMTKNQEHAARLGRIPHHDLKIILN